MRQKLLIFKYCFFISLQCFQCLQVLALNACKLSSWREVVLLNTFLPQLEELYLTNNDLSDIPSDYNQQTNEGKEEPSFLQGINIVFPYLSLVISFSY